jgi:hypothetical protein
MVGVNTGSGIEWSHLVAEGAEQTSGVVTGGKALVVRSAGPDARYLVVEVPVSPEEATAATAAAESQLAIGKVGPYQLGCQDCTTKPSRACLKGAGLSTTGEGS